jgi:hypothetical protein
MKQKLLAIVAGIGAVLAALLFFLRYNPKKDLEENQATKDKVKDLEKDIAVNNVSIKAEEIKRDQLKEDILKEQDEKVNSDNVVDFFNKR